MENTRSQNLKERREQVTYFVNKYKMKMNNSVPSVAAYWIDGIGEMRTSDKRKVWKRIQKNIDQDSRDRGWENEDYPSWI